jgi:hypothetical protein
MIRRHPARGRLPDRDDRADSEVEDFEIHVGVVRDPVMVFDDD